jgi:hypothetical protein
MGYSIRTQDGIVIDNIPDNIAPDSPELKTRVAQARAGNTQTQAPSMPEAPKSYTGGEAAMQGLRNLPGGIISSAVETGKALLNPVDTSMALLDLGAGELQKALPKSVTSAINRADEYLMGKEQAQKNQERMAMTANAVNEQYKNRYGSMEGFKRDLAENPEAVLADLSTVLTGGASLAGKAPKLASALKTASNVTNPLVMAEKLVTGPANLAASLTKGSLGVTTGTGGEAIGQAVKAGETSNKAFLGNLRKASNMEDAVDVAKSGLNKMRNEKNAAYRSGMYDISQDKSMLNFDDVDAAIQSAKDKNIKFGEYIDEDAHKALVKAEGIVNKWKTKTGDAHTPEGFDALKQKVYNEVLGKLDFQKDAFARNIVGDIYSGIKGSINKQAPEYAKVMKNYGEAADTIDEIKKALSLGEKASADTSLKKLQSILRDDVSSSFGHRKQLAEKLIESGAEDLMPALAGQALSPFKPRGLGGQLETYGGLAYLLANPAALGSAVMAAPFAMPRVVGEAAYAYGKGKGAVKKAAQKLPVNKEQARKIGLMLMQANQANEANQEEQ